jgi:hypothetical protein
MLLVMQTHMDTHTYTHKNMRVQACMFKHTPNCSVQCMNIHLQKCMNAKM